MSGPDDVARELRLRMNALDLMNEAAAIANEATGVTAALQSLLDAVCGHLGWDVGHVYEAPLDQRADLIPTTIWHLSDPERFQTFKEVTEATPLPPGKGLPGRVFEVRRPVWIHNIMTDTNFPRNQLARDLGVKSATGAPVLVSGEVRFVLEFFSDGFREPEELLDEVMTHICAQLSHVIEREISRQALLLSEQQARLVVETANDAFVGIDSKSVITDWNARSVELFGWSKAEAVGRFLHETMIPEQYRDAHVAGLQKFLDTGEGPVLFNPIEITAIHRDGHEFPIELTIWPVEVPDGFIFNAFVRDLTERKQMEARLSQAQRMDAIGQLAGGVAHDFNNLLAVIQSYAGFVADEVAHMEGPSADVAEILNACRRATGVTRQLLRLSRSEVARPEVSDLNEVVTSAEKLLKRTLPETIVLEAATDPELWPVVIDAGQFGLVVMNLAVNARDAMPRGGEICIGTSNHVHTLDDASLYPAMPPGDYAGLTVTDNGEGMDAATIERIFEPFFTTKEHGKGTGLGLATVYGIVKQSGGFVYVESELGSGTTFTVFVPRSLEGAASQAPAGDPTVPGPAGGVVLLVEDQDDVRAVVSRMLKKNGYAVLEANSPLVALDLFRSSGPLDLLVTDVVMPHMSGRELALELARHQEPLCVVYMSGYTDRIIEEFESLTELESYVQKPFKEHELMKAIAEVTRARS